MRPGHRQIQVKSLFIMIGIAMIVTSAAFLTLYRIVLERTEIQLVEMARSQARLIESIAKFDAVHSRGGVSRAATLSQVRESNYRYRGFGETGQIVLAELRDSTIHFLLPEPKLDFEIPPPVAINSGEAEPMALAVSGRSGVLRGNDLKGADVLAAYEYLPFLEVGLVAKIEMTELLNPFFNAALLTGLMALLSLVLVTLLHGKIVGPLVDQVISANEELLLREAKLENLSTQLSRYLSPQIYHSMFEGTSEARIYTQRKKLTVFFSDVVGFTARADSMEPEDLSYELNTYLDAMAKVADKHGGTLDKFVGDAVLVFFGDPVSRGVEEDALACIDMAWEMRDRINDLCAEWRARGLDAEFQVRMGVATGYCTVGNFGSESRMEYTIIGNHVNLASRFETSAAPDEILITAETHSLVEALWDCVETEPVVAKGFRNPVRAFQVVEPKSTVTKRGEFRKDSVGYSLHLDPEAVPGSQRADVERGLREALAALRRAGHGDVPPAD